MARALSIAAYLAGLGASDRFDTLDPQPPRPKGVVIWVRCCDPAQLTAIETLSRRLGEDGDPVTLVTTITQWDESLRGRALPQPYGKENICAFLAHWSPVMMIWVHGYFDPIILEQVRVRGIATMLVNASVSGLEVTAGNWVPGAMRSILPQFDAVLTLDQDAAERLIRAGARPSIVRVCGAMEDGAPPLPYHYEERQKFAAAVGTRPAWLVVWADLKECIDLCAAHVIASRRAHRLLMIVVPRDVRDAAEFVEQMRAAGLHVARHSQEPEPSDPTQVYVVDTETDLGLWYRISPITYLGGTLRGAPCRDPFEAATLGSALLYGPRVAPFEKHAARLNAAGASRLLRSASDLGPNVESLLATDKVAELAHAAWDVTSRGADVTNRIVSMVQRRLTELGY